MNENDQALQTMVEYYRNKCNKLEHDFLIYKIGAENIIRQLKDSITEKTEQVSE
jgi:tellurite resistance protein